jgi:shikimate kinase
LRAIKKSGGITVALTDKPENMLERVTFYDRNSNLVKKDLTPVEKREYLKEIKKDIAYFKKTYERADLRVNVEGMLPEQAARRVTQHVEAFAKAGRK